MNFFKRTALAFAAFLAICDPAAAQWQVPSHSVPLGRGAGVQGFGSVGPCAAGSAIVGTGTTTDPVCGQVGYISGTASVTGANTTYTAAQNTIMVRRSNSGVAMSDTLPGTSPGVLPANTIVTVQNNDTAGILSIKVGTGSAFKTVATGTGYVYVCPGQTKTFYSDGANYFTVGRGDACLFAAPTVIYVATTGANSNDGLTAATPLADIQAAWNLAQQNFNLNGNSLTIQLATGTYAKTLFLAGLIPGQGFGDVTQSQPSSDTNVFIVGNTTTPANVVVGGNAGSGTVASFGIFNIYNGARVAVLGVKLTSTFNQYGFYVSQAWLSFKNMDFGAVTGTGSKIQISLQTGAWVSAYTPYTISAGSGCHIMAASGGFFQFLGNTGTVPGVITLTGTPAFTSGFACVQQGGGISVSVVNTFSGSATGARYNGSFNGSITAGDPGGTYFPGNATGVVSTGAQYD